MLFVVPASMPEKQFSKQGFQLIYFEILKESRLDFAKSSKPAQNVAPKPDLLGKAVLLFCCSADYEDVEFREVGKERLLRSILQGQ